MLCLSEQDVQETIYLLYLVCFSNEPLAFAFCLFPRYPPLQSWLFINPSSQAWRGHWWIMYTCCVCKGVAKSFFTESSRRITEARKELLWIWRPKEQMRHVQNLLPKRFQANCILGSILCVESDSYIKLSWILKTVRAPPPTPNNLRQEGSSGLWSLQDTGESLQYLAVWSIFVNGAGLVFPSTSKSIYCTRNTRKYENKDLQFGLNLNIKWMICASECSNS